MRNKVKRIGDENDALENVLAVLEQELLGCSDEEIYLVAKDLGFDPNMKGSAIYAGLTFPNKPQLQDFFDVNDLGKFVIDSGRGKAILPDS